MMIKRFAMATALLLAASVASAHVPNIFVAGQPAKAQEINENFEHLLDEHSNYGVGGSTDGAGGTTAGTTDGVDVGGTTAGTDAGGTTTGGAAPVGGGDQFYYAYVEDGVLKSADAIEGGTSPSTSNKLIDANDIVLRFITQGSLDLPQDFVIFDYDTEPTQTKFAGGASFGENVVIQFTAAADGSVGYSTGSVLGDSTVRYYESSDCTGQEYLNANMLRTSGTVYKLDGAWIRLPLYDASTVETSITAGSVKNDDANMVVSSGTLGDAGCKTANLAVPQAVIPIAYDPEPILLKVKAPVSVVAP